MTEFSKLADMDSDNLYSICEAGDLGDAGGHKISVSDQINCLQHTGTESDSLVVDMERFSHIIEKEINSKSRVTLQRSLSRKVSSRNMEKKTTGNERDTSTVATSPRAIHHGNSSVPENAAEVELGDPDQSSNNHHHHHHHQITITTTTTAESKTLRKRPSFRRSSSNIFSINPRKLLFFFATLSCMGTIVLIYFTLSMSKMNGDDIDAAALN